MSKIIINTKEPPCGEIKINGSKNAALPILASSILLTQDCKIQNVPNLSDIKNMRALLTTSGMISTFSKNCYSSEVATEISPYASYEMTAKLRASFLLAGPLLAKKGFLEIAYPGGCPIGARPIDLHLKGFSKLGANITSKNGYIQLKCKKLRGAKIYLDFKSVGATENIMIASTVAKGKTIIENAAGEPEVVDLANFLNAMGADIRGAGTNTITICGVEFLKGGEYTVIPDRIEAGTYMIMAAATGGKIKLTNVIPDHLLPVIAKLKETGTTVSVGKDTITVEGKSTYDAVDIKTLPYPGFPTDLQAQFCAMLSKAKGTSIVTETIFENRFMHLGELKRMGANITQEGSTAIIEGTQKLFGAQVKASDLRAGAALIIAALMAEGTCVIEDCGHIQRGYCNIIENLKSLNIDVTTER